MMKQATSKIVAHMQRKVNTNTGILSSLLVDTSTNITTSRDSESKRFYRGEATEGVSQLSDAEMILYYKAKPKSDEILINHRKLPDLSKIPLTSFHIDTDTDGNTTTTTTADNTNTEDNTKLLLELRKKRLLYRSKQRGWLEVDLLLGIWASENIHQLNEQQLNEYENFVNYETIDIYNIITNRLSVPNELQGTIVDTIQQWAITTNPLGKADPITYERMKEQSNLI